MKASKRIQAPKAPPVACDQMPSRWLTVSRAIGRGASKDAAETALRDKVLDLAEKERKANKAECKGKCAGGGSCFTTVELSGNVQFKRAKRGGSRMWLCIYDGTASSACICA